MVTKYSYGLCLIGMGLEYLFSAHILANSVASRVKLNIATDADNVSHIELIRASLKQWHGSRP